MTGGFWKTRGYMHMLSFDHNKFLRSPSRSLIQWSFRKVHCFSWDWFVNNSRGVLFCIIFDLQGIAIKYQGNSAYSQHLPNTSKTKRSDWEWSLWVWIMCGFRCTPSISRWNIPLIPSPLFPALPFPGHPRYMSFFVFGLRSRWETRGFTARWFVLRTSKEHGFVWHQRLKRRRAVLRNLSRSLEVLGSKVNGINGISREPQ